MTLICVSLCLSLSNKRPRRSTYYFWNKIYRYHLLALKGTVFQTPLMKCSLGYPALCVRNHGGGGEPQGKVHTGCVSPPQLAGTFKCGGRKLCEVSLDLLPSLHHRPGLPTAAWWVARGPAGADPGISPGCTLFLRISALHTKQRQTVSPGEKCFPSDDRLIAFEGKVL